MRPLTALFYWPLGLAFLLAILYLLYLSLPQQIKNRVTKSPVSKKTFKEQING